MESAYKILEENISIEDIKLLTDIGLFNENINIMKVSLLILKQNNIKEEKLYTYKGFEHLLIHSTDPLKTLRYLLADAKEKDEKLVTDHLKDKTITTKSLHEEETKITTQNQKSIEWQSYVGNNDIKPEIIKPNIHQRKLVKILTEFICEIFNPLGCSTYGRKISESLIRVAACRIFSDPEQSIMELPVNSVDAYNSLVGGKSVGKFGMGFFSMLYWITEAYNGKYVRKLYVQSTYKDNDESLKSYVVKLSWSENGLIVDREILDSSPIFNVYTGHNEPNLIGTRIMLTCGEHIISNESIELMKKYIYRLFPIQGTSIYLNNVRVNNIFHNRVNVWINNQNIVVDDNATGISDDVLIHSLLVPSSSTKQRNNEIEPFKSPEMIPHTSNELNIIVNNVCINTIQDLGIGHTTNNFFRYNIYMPFNSKLPVSRDNIIFERDSMEVTVIEKAIKQLINISVNTTRSIVIIFSLLETYIKSNQSDELSRILLKVRMMIEKSPFILLPNNPFWMSVINTVSPEVKSKLVLYDRPDINDTERKLETLYRTSIRTDIFKLRKIIFGNFQEFITTNGLTTFLFIDNKMNTKSGLSSLALSNPTTLLIPSQDPYVLDIFDPANIKIDIAKQCIDNVLKRPNLLNTGNIFHMTMMRKFMNLSTEYMKLSYASYIVPMVFSATEDEEFTISFLSTLTSKICNMKLEFSYGIQPSIYESFMSKFKVDIDNKPITKTINSEFNEAIKLVTKRLLMLYIDIIQEKSVAFGVTLPPIESFLLSLFFFYSFRTDFIVECINGINACVTSSELFIFMTSYISFMRSNNKVDTSLNGLAVFLVNEINRKYSQPELYDMIVYQFSSNNNNRYLDSKILTHLKLVAEQYQTYSSLKSVVNRIELNSKYKFSCKSLLEYIYNNEINDFTFDNLHELYPKFNRGNFKLQVVEIAVNEGTTKTFINSVLTELVQNSVDAVRSNDDETEKFVDITIGENSISVTDYIGFSDILNILIPFLSSKNPNDPNVTGEMGTGFFNVYRQPWTRFIVIETCKNGKKYTVKATPLHENNVVYDIEYNISIETGNYRNGTSITLFLNKENNLIPQVITDAYIFTYSYLSFIKSAYIRLNGSLITSNYELCFPGDLKYTDEYRSIGEIKVLDSPTTESYILTNDIPFMSLENFIKSLDTPILNMMVKNFGRSSIIINLNKNVYKPTQARSKITFVKSKIDLVKNFLLNGIYIAILTLYTNNHYVNPDEIIPHTESKSNYNQLKMSEMSDKTIISFCNQFLHYRMMTGNVLSAMNLINLINGSIDQQIDYRNIDRSTIIGRVIYKWFSNKRDNSIDDGKLVKVNPPESFVKLQIFVNIYWRLFRRLIDERIIICDNKITNPPTVMLASLNCNVLGDYNKSKHEIRLSRDYYNMSLFDTEIMKFKDKNITSITTLFNTSNILMKYFSPCKPACALLHELGHAVNNNEHSNTYHGVTNVSLRNGDRLGFEDMCTIIYQLCVERGLITEFLQSI